MSEQQRREISYKVIKTQSKLKNHQQLNDNNHVNDIDSSSSPPRYDDIKKTSSHFNNHPPLEDDTGSIVIV